jgi:hypothetical protein
MKDGVSEIIGQAVFGDGSKVTAYRALRPLWCASCSNVVAEGEMFTRDRQAGQGLRLWPRCQACVPFALDPGKQARSSLLQNLLTPAEPGPAATMNHSRTEEATKNEQQKVKDERQKASEAMRQRLGPALERARRSRSGNR